MPKAWVLVPHLSLAMRGGLLERRSCSALGALKNVLGMFNRCAFARAELAPHNG